MEVKTITVRCDRTAVEAVDGELVDVTLYNVCLADLLCEFNINDIWQALVDADKSYSITLKANEARGEDDGEE